jgi:hypothetical protein
MNNFTVVVGLKEGVEFVVDEARTVVVVMNVVSFSWRVVMLEAVLLSSKHAWRWSDDAGQQEQDQRKNISI